MGMCLKVPVMEVKWSSVPDLLCSFLERVKQESDAIPNIYLADAATDALVYHQADLTAPTVMVMGSEAHGLSPQALNLMRFNARKVQIPMVNNLESLNAAVAASILLAEVSRQRFSNNGDIR